VGIGVSYEVIDMRILVISDIHANLTALDAVLEAAGSVDEIWCLGDVVGYGPDPNECVERLRSLPNLTCLIGNHDAAALGNIDLNAFNREARASAHWTQSVLSEESRQFLSGLPEQSVAHEVTLVHGSPRSPVWEYLLDPVSAYDNLAYFNTRLCFIGHTHIPMAFSMVDGLDEMESELLRNGQSPAIEGRMFLNPGSVGQPRDHNPMAAFAIYDPDISIWRAHRAVYDIESVQSRMLQVNLPNRLIHRLVEGW
jgi:diadenosine tetraphosphatase ApaH/serine/threonine PP2A family protein phosphatase